jgi:dTDP-glucose 4,6-dehydratase
LVKRLASHGHRILNIDKITYAANPIANQELLNGSQYELVIADICDRKTLTNAFERFRPDWVVHLAAESHVDRSILDPAAFIQTNIIGTYQLLETATAYWSKLDSEKSDRFRFVHVSTDEVFGSLGADGQFTESSPYDPHSPYSASKAASDHLVRAWRITYGLPAIVSNCCNNFGPHQYPEKLIPVVINRALGNESIPVYGNGQNVRDWIYVDDHCRALEMILERGDCRNDYVIGAGHELQNIQLVGLLCDLLDEMQPRLDSRSYREQIAFVADRPGHDFRYAVDASKIKQELGWTPETDFRAAMAHTVGWYVSHYASSHA